MANNYEFTKLKQTIEKENGFTYCEVFDTILKECGPEIFENEKQFINIYYDYATNKIDKKYDSIIRILAENHVFQQLINMMTQENVQIEESIRKISKQLAQQTIFDENKLQIICASFAYSYLKPNFQNKDANAQQDVREEAAKSNFENNKWNTHNKKFLKIAVIVCIIGLAGFFITDSASGQILKGNYAYGTAQYKKSLGHYVKSLAKEDSEEAFTGVANAMIGYINNEKKLEVGKDILSDEYLNKIFEGTGYTPLYFIDAGLRKYPESETLKQLKNDLEKAWDCLNNLNNASLEPNTAVAENQYLDIINQNPDSKLAHEMYGFNHLESLINEGNWQEVLSYAEGMEIFSTLKKNTFIAFQEDKPILTKATGNYAAIGKNKTGKGMAYRGELNENVPNGNGTLAIKDSNNDEIIKVGQSTWEQGTGNGPATVTFLGAFQALYEGNLADGLWDGDLTIHIDGHTGVVSVNQGTVTPAGTSEDGKPIVFTDGDYVLTCDSTENWGF